MGDRGRPAKGGEGLGDRVLEPLGFARGGFVASLPFDRRLGRVDVLGSLAHVAMLTRRGIITAEDGSALAEGLRRIHEELVEGTFPFDDSLEDIHTNVEARLLDLVGEPAKALHTARSRNDQVSLDERLWLRATILEILRATHALQGALVALARERWDTLVPGYTHLQRAQPLLLAHHLLSHVWALRRDFDRFVRAYHDASISPLGAGALAGTSLGIDPGFVAHLLGLHGVFENSLDAVEDRDHVAFFLFAATLQGLHLARLAEDIVLWSTQEFNFLRPTVDAGGSSLMVHKRNPDVAELVRAKAGRLLGDLTGFLAVLKGLPSGYNRDLQEDKPAAFDAADTLLGCVGAMADVVEAMEFNPGALEAAAQDPAMLSVDRVEALVLQGKRFRDAYAAVQGELQRAAWDPGDARASVGQKTSPGGTAPAAVEAQLDALAGVLGRQSYTLGVLAKEVARIEDLLGNSGSIEDRRSMV